MSEVCQDRVLFNDGLSREDLVEENAKLQAEIKELRELYEKVTRIRDGLLREIAPSLRILKRKRENFE